VLLQLETKRIYERLKEKKEEFVLLYSLKRTRRPFEILFESKLKNLNLSFFENFSEEICLAYFQFFSSIEELEWYLLFTEDLPLSLEQHVEKLLKTCKCYYDVLQLYLRAELEVHNF